MDKNAIKKYAVWARRELIERVSQRALIYGISADAQADANAVIVNGQALDAVQQKQRKALIEQIKEKGYEQVMEEVAYTWFNRFAALRFMEVNGYLPSHIRVFTDDDGAFRPQILTEAIHLELDGLDMEKVYALERENKREELFKYLLIVQCNALSSILPGMFQKIEDYTELLLPDYLLREGSVIEQMVTQIAEEDWTDQVQIIGWLYQYYNTEPKDQVFADLKKNIKISKEKIPAATQLFTPDWIVHYMVENSLGRLWIEGHPDSAVSLLPTEEEQAAYAAGERSPSDTKWHYYLEEAPQEPEVEAQLKEIRKEYAALKPEEILCIDPCMGSGHILCVLFDVLVRIYEDYGYTAREAAVSIVENNLWGLDIDDRAAQLAYFAVMMKARQYDRRFFSRKIQPHVYAIAESNHVSNEAVAYFCNGDAKLERAMQTIIKELHDAKEYGSILTTTPQDWDALYARFDEIRDEISIYKNAALALEPLVQTAQALGQKYWVTVTNPPYAGINNLNEDVANYVKKQFSEGKSDLFAVFMQRCSQFTKINCFQAMITQHVWMFLSAFENLRATISKYTTVNLAHLGPRAFEEIGGEVVQTASYVFRKTTCPNYKAIYCRLLSGSSQSAKEMLFLSKNHKYVSQQKNFKNILGAPIVYWANNVILDAFKENPKIRDIANPRLGFATGDNDAFMRFWFEPSICNVGFGYTSRKAAKESNLRWFPTNKGGSYRKWYGNFELVVDWQEDGFRIRNFKDVNGKLRSRPQNLRECFSDGITWTVICNHSSFRYSPLGMLYNNKGPILGEKQSEENYIVMGYLNSNVAEYILQMLSPTLGFESGYISNLPYKEPTDKRIEILNIAKENIALSRDDWDSFENSWDFKIDPMIARRISSASAWGDNYPQM